MADVPTDIRTYQLMCGESLAKSMSTGRDLIAVNEYFYARQEREASRATFNIEGGNLGDDRQTAAQHAVRSIL